MARSAGIRKRTDLRGRFAAFVAERHPLAVADATEAFTATGGDRTPNDHDALERLRPLFRRELARRLTVRTPSLDLPERTAGVSADARLERARDEVLDACDGWLRRAAIEASLTAGERLE